MPCGEFCPNTKEKVFLIKEESELALEHGGTNDTKYILPAENRVPCTTHTEPTPPPPGPNDGEDTY